MDLSALKEILNSNLDTAAKEIMIIQVLAKDKNVIPLVMDILNDERAIEKELRDDINIELSRAHVYIDEYTEHKNESKKQFTKTFVVEKIEEFYKKYKGHISHRFKQV